MSKVVQEFDVVFDKKEVKEIQEKQTAVVLNAVINHFIEQEGWTLEEVKERVTPTDILVDRAYWPSDDGELGSELVGLRVPVEVKMKV